MSQNASSVRCSQRLPHHTQASLVKIENSCFHNQPSTKNDGSEEYPIPLGEKRKCTQNSPLFFIYCFECMLLPKFYPFFRQCVILKIGNVFSLQLLFTFHELVTIHLVLTGMARRDCYGSTLSAKEFRHQCILCEVLGRRDRVMATACSDLPVLQHGFDSRTWLTCWFSWFVVLILAPMFFLKFHRVSFFLKNQPLQIRIRSVNSE